MLSRLKETIRSEKTLADEIRLPLVDGLFYPFASLIVGALTVLWIAATVTILVEDLWVQAVADFTLVVALARIAIGFRYISLKKAGRPQQRRFLGRRLRPRRRAVLGRPRHPLHAGDPPRRERARST